MAAIMEKQEDNSYHRGRQGAKDAKDGREPRIRGQDKYRTSDGKAIAMGTVELTLHYNHGCLTVDLHNAKNLAGKRSQDSYANVFLVDASHPTKWVDKQKVMVESGHKHPNLHGLPMADNDVSKCGCEDANISATPRKNVSHEMTMVFNKNLNPDFNEQFKFQTSVSDKCPDINKKCLVISIWDKDTSSKDDFMAGVMLPLLHLERFKNLGKRVKVDLQVQEMNGYPKQLEQEAVWRWQGGLQEVETVSWDLKECNNRLVTYIDRARVLRQAYEMNSGLPGDLHDRTSIVVKESTNFLAGQVEELRMKIADAQRRKEAKKQERQQLQLEVEQRQQRYEDQATKLTEKLAKLNALSKEEADLRCRECSGSSLRDYYRDFPQASHTSSFKPPAVTVEELAITKVELNAVNVGRDSKNETFEKILIKIRTEYHDRFLAALEAARRKYKKQSKLEISIEEDIMKIYQELIRQRADTHGLQYSLAGLAGMERSKDYQGRIRQLLLDIQSLQGRIASHPDPRPEWGRRMIEIDAELDAALARLKAAMGQLSLTAVTTETSLDEVAMMQQLLDFESERLSARSHAVRRVTVSTRTSHRSSSASASAAYSRSYSSSSTAKGSTYRKRDSSADSGKGYSKAATPDGTLDYGNKTFEFDEFSSRTSGRSSRNSTKSGFLGDLQGDI